MYLFILQMNEIQNGEVWKSGVIFLKNVHKLLFTCAIAMISKWE